MITYEDECCGCATESYPCLGNACPNRNVKHLYCDKCKDDVEKLDTVQTEKGLVVMLKRRYKTN